MEYTGTIILAICLIGIFLTGVGYGYELAARKTNKKLK